MAFAFVWCHTVRVDAFKVVSCKGTNRFAGRVGNFFVLWFAETPVGRQACHVKATRWFALGQTPEVIHCVISGMTLTLVVSYAARVYANVPTHRNAFFADCVKAHAAFLDCDFHFLILRWDCGMVEYVFAENHKL